MSADWEAGGFGVYIHWPFCEAKCPYCDFNSHVTNTVDHEAWRKRLVQDIRFQAERLGRRPVQSIFFGGGTPSLMEPKTVAACIDTINDVFQMVDGIEITLEANPTSVEAAKFRGFANAGVNRVSIGVQALNDPDLKRLGRLHNTAEAINAIELARKNFERMSFDLIYARQDQNLRDWGEELKKAISLAADHLSLYQLTIENGTAFGRLNNEGKLRGLPSDNLSADMYELTQGICTDAGLPGYEVSNHALPGAESRHNLIYWRYGDYLGIGPGAHGRVTVGNTRYATEAARMPNDWLSNLPDRATQDVEALSSKEQFIEFLLMGLRLEEGIDLQRASGFGPLLPKDELSKLIDDGFIELSNQRLKVITSNKIFLNQILRDILSDI